MIRIKWRVALAVAGAALAASMFIPKGVSVAENKKLEQALMTDARDLFSAIYRIEQENNLSSVPLKEVAHLARMHDGVEIMIADGKWFKLNSSCIGDVSYSKGFYLRHAGYSKKVAGRIDSGIGDSVIFFRDNISEPKF